MKSWTRFAAALLGLSALSAYSALAQNLPVAAPESVGMSSAKLDNIKKTFQAEVDNGHIPGAVVMINRRGKLVYSEAVGYQNKDANLAMKKDSLFRIYSMTKPLAAVAALILEEEGKIVLADPVSKYLPDLPIRRSAMPARVRKARQFVLWCRPRNQSPSKICCATHLESVTAKPPRIPSSRALIWRRESTSMAERTMTSVAFFPRMR